MQLLVLVLVLDLLAWGGESKLNVFVLGRAILAGRQGPFRARGYWSRAELQEGNAKRRVQERNGRAPVACLTSEIFFRRHSQLSPRGKTSILDARPMWSVVAGELLEPGGQSGGKVCRVLRATLKRKNELIAFESFCLG